MKISVKVIVIVLMQLVVLVYSFPARPALFGVVSQQGSASTTIPSASNPLGFRARRNKQAQEIAKETTKRNKQPDTCSQAGEEELVCQTVHRLTSTPLLFVADMFSLIVSASAIPYLFDFRSLHSSFGRKIAFILGPSVLVASIFIAFEEKGTPFLYEVISACWMQWLNTFETLIRNKANNQEV